MKQDKKLIAKYNKTQDKDLLENRGIRTERILYNKEIFIGHYTDIEPVERVFLEVTLKEIDLSTQAVYRFDCIKKIYELVEIGTSEKTTIKGKSVQKYRVLSISGHSKNRAGQIYDSLLDKDFRPLFQFKFKIGEIVSLWKRWHLNDMKTNPDGWLLEELPEDILEHLEELFGGMRA